MAGVFVNSDPNVVAAQKWSLPQMAGWVLARRALALLMPFAVIPAWRWWRGRGAGCGGSREWAERAGCNRAVSWHCSQVAAKGFARRNRQPRWSLQGACLRQSAGGQATRVVRFTELYNAVRFGGRTAAAGELAEMLAAFDA